MTEVKNQYKVLRLYEGGSEPSDDWHKINNPYGPNDISKIKDPAGSNDLNEITSIPSPFARIHLFETAFRVLADQSSEDLALLDGNTIYHKLVSDCLDVAELFFKYDFFSAKYKLNIIPWSKSRDLKALLESSNPQHRLLGETLDLYIRQDGELSNFDKMENLYFITLNHQIVGGTSPSTLFFSSGNDLSFAQIVQGNDTFFDREYAPLFQRDLSFQKYLYSLFKVYPELTNRMLLVWKYLVNNLKYLAQNRPEAYTEIKKIQEDPTFDLLAFKQTYKAWDNTQSVSLFPGMEHFKKELKIDQQTIGGFMIDSQKYSGKKPVVLQNAYSRPLAYFGGKWQADIKVPYKDDDPLDQRFVPGQDVQYPYLTVSDLLEPYLIEVPYAMDNDHFFNGNPKGFFMGDRTTQEPPDNMYLIPVQNTFFDYFEISDLMGNTKDGRPMLEINSVPDGVKVTLLLPIVTPGEYIKFERLYKTGGKVDEYSNEGAIYKCKISLGLMPFYSDVGKVEQRVGFVDADVLYSNNKESLYKLNFLKISQSGHHVIEPRLNTTRSDESKNHGHNATSRYFVLDKAYDLIEVGQPSGVRGLVVPKFQQSFEGSKQYTFAIDFGTTNSHIEYSVDGSNPEPFNIHDRDRQLITLFDDFWGLNDPQLEGLLMRELIPYHIGGESRYQFPMRTAISEVDNLNHYQSTFPLGDLTIPFHYEKLETLQSELIKTNLKWSRFRGDDGTVNANRVNAFIETLLIMIRNKVLIGGGSLQRTRIIWFYPSSMSTNQVNQFRRIWNRLFQKYIHADGEPIDFSESEVPFYNHPPTLVKSQRYPVVNIDIGGGTTDIVLFEKDQPKFLTSIKFAGNAVFGDGYRNDISADNGFIRTFKPVVQTFLEHNQHALNSLKNVFEQLSEPGRSSSADLMAFFFSLEKNKDLEDKNLNFSFSDKVASHEEFNIIFIIFYGAIVYHIAKMMKALNCEMPRNICLSGNGSKIIKLLDASRKLKSVEKLSRLIFEKVYGTEYHAEGLTMVQGDRPKEATCKGGIRKLIDNKLSEDYDRIVLLGDGNNTLVNHSPNHYAAGSLKYQEVTDLIKASAIQETSRFIDLIMDLHNQFDFEDNFGISPSSLTTYRRELKRDIEDSMERGLIQRLDLSDPDKNIEETLFFYPLIASMYHLSQVIAEKKNN